MTIKKLRKIAQKGDSEPFWISRYIVRKVSIYVTFLFLKIGVTATQTTIVSAFFAMAGSVFLVLDIEYRYLLSALFIFIFFLLDHVDGEIARYNSVTKKGPDASSFIDIAGSYFDQIIHYYQGPSFFFCLGAGLSFLGTSQIWFWLGLIAALGSGGFPRFVACFNILNIVEKERSSAFFDYVAQYSKFNVVHFPGDKKQADGFQFPTNFSDIIGLGRQLFGFPGNIFIFMILSIVNIFLTNSLLVFKAFILFYALILFMNMVYSIIKYYRALKKIPE